MIAAGTRFSVVCSEKGHLYWWGDASGGQLCREKDPIEDWPPVRQLSAGLFHAAAVLSSGDVRFLGCCEYGQFPEDRVAHGGKDPFVQVECGAMHSAALRASGLVETWTRKMFSASDPPADALFTQISAGDFFTAGLRADGRVCVWGRLTDLELLTPPPDERFVAVSCGAKHCAGITATTGDLVVWGSGNHTGRHRGPFSLVSCGGFHTAALLRTGRVLCFGGDIHKAPVGSFRDLAAGYMHTIGIRTDGSLEVWGEAHAGCPPVRV